MGRDVVLVSSADETAFVVRDLLVEEGLRAVAAAAEQHLFLTSGPVDTFRTLGARFLGPEVKTIEAWQWS
jgi:glutamate racemase